MKVLFAAGVIVMTGCKQAVTEQGYINYINDPKYKITQQIKVGDVQATVKWLPAAYRQLKNKKTGIDTTGTDDGFYFFDVRFDKTGGEKPSDEKILYLNFDMQGDFMLLDGSESILPVICQKIENGTPGSYQYMLAFEKKARMEEESDFSVLYKDKVFGIGTIAFVYRKKDIQKIPKLKQEKKK